MVITMYESSNLNKKISELLYDIFVVNSGVIGLQMPDGKYIPQIINYDSSIFEKMLERKMSLGIYQQQYYRNVTKWVCLDFDCKDIDDDNLPHLVESLVKPCIELLRKFQISYLLEFSGRRGVHIWIIFDTIISKAQAYSIVANIKHRLLLQDETFYQYAIDIFPKISGGINKYGSMVKCPLSWHRKGKQSFLMEDISEFITATGLNFDVILEKQLLILENCKKNDYQSVCEKLNLSQSDADFPIPQYKKHYLLVNGTEKLYSLTDIEEKCSDSIVFKRLFQSIRRGSLSHLDRLILVSTFSYFSKELLVSFFELQDNYNYDKTKEYINKYSSKYYPISMKYLYDIYGKDIELNIDPNISALEFICQKLDIPKELIVQIEEKYNSKSSKLENIIAKEITYMQYNDEVLDVVDFYKISNLKKFDLSKINQICSKSITDGELITPRKFKKYVRTEKENKSPRTLVSLSPYDRVITSYLMFELASEVNWRFDSFSYNINFLPQKDIFFSWFHSWNKFNNAISMYVNTELFEDLNVIKVDIKKCYDNIYFHSMYDEILNKLNDKSSKKENGYSKIKNIFDVLCKYNDQIMMELTGNIRGVPQGPAYARIMAEIFIANVISIFKKNNPNLIILRYVDDMFILHDSSRNSSDIIKELESLLITKGLELNGEKTKIYGLISSLSSDDRYEICESNSNYSIKIIKSLELETSDNREFKLDIFKKFILENGDWTKDANFILNDYIENEFIEIYLSKYYKSIISSAVGRGSVFKKLYQYIFNTDKWLSKFLNEMLYKSIPSQSINMKCMLNQLLKSILNDDLYLQVDNISSLIDFIISIESLDRDNQNLISVINKKWKEYINGF